MQQRQFARLTNQDVSIKKIETKKDKIRQPDLALPENNMVIPPLGSSVLISGKSGSGKSTLLANLLLDKRFYKGYFHKIFLFSPTAKGDDIQKHLGIPANHVFTDLEEAPELLEVILRSQQEKLEHSTADKVPQYCIIFDDVIGDVKFMNSKEFSRCFYQVRHVCCTTFICTQHFTRVPRMCRLQANFIMYFKGSMSETERLVEEFQPPDMHKKQFEAMVNFATRDTEQCQFNFITINMKLGWDKRFRRNLDELLDTSLDYLSMDDTLMTEQQQRGYEEESKNYAYQSMNQQAQQQTQTQVNGQLRIECPAGDKRGRAQGAAGAGAHWQRGRAY